MMTRRFAITYESIRYDVAVVIAKRSEAICACTCNMLIICRPDCFIAIISSGLKRNSVKAIRNDGAVVIAKRSEAICGWYLHHADNLKTRLLHRPYFHRCKKK